MINKRGGNPSVNNEGFQVVKSSAQKKRNAKAKKKNQTQNNSKPNVKTNYKHNPNNFPNLPKPATRASTRPKSGSRASTRPKSTSRASTRHKSGSRASTRSKPATRESTRPKSGSRASTNNSNIVFGNFNKEKKTTNASNNWGAITPNASNSSWGAITPNASNNSWSEKIPNAWKTEVTRNNLLRQAKEAGWLNNADTEKGTSPKRKSKSKTSNSTSTKPKSKPKIKAPPKPAFYGLTQPQFKKELEKIGFKYKEVPNAEYSNNTNLVFVGKKGYLLFSPSNNNKVKHLEKNNKNNPYKIAINDYKSVSNGTKRKYTTKGRFLLALKKKYKAVSNARTARKNARKKALNKGKKAKTNSLTKMGKQIEANGMTGGKKHGAKQQKRKKLKKAIQNKQQFYNKLTKGQEVFVKAFSGKRKGVSNNNPRIAQWFPGKIISVSNGKIKKYEVEVNNLSSNQNNGIGYNDLGPNMRLVVGKSCIANINSSIIQSKAFRIENTNNGKRYVRNKNNGTKIVRSLKSRNKLTNKLYKQYKK